MWRRIKGLFFLLFLLGSYVSPSSLQADGGALYPSPLDRFGFNVVTEYGSILDYDVARLRAGWYADWRVEADPPRPHGMKFVQVVRVGAGAYPPNWESLGRAIDNNPGSLWLIGNEPDTRGQDDRLPADYARAYHELYTFIKGRDSTAQLSAPGIVQPTRLRLQWLDMVWQAYQDAYGATMPVDVWNMHIQILREDRNDWGCGIPPGINVDQGELYSVYDNVSVDIFRQHVLTFRQWMYAHGERNKPLIISEYGALQPSEYLGGGDPVYGDSLVKSFMTNTFDYMLTAVHEEWGYPMDGNRLVQQWAWYSLNDKLIDLETFVGYNGPLYDWRYPTYPGVITQFGLTYAAYTARLARHRLHLPFLLRGQGDPPSLVGHKP